MEWNTLEKAQKTETDTRTDFFLKRGGQARLIYFKDIDHNIPTTWRWARGDTPRRWVAISNLYMYCVANCGGQSRYTLSILRGAYVADKTLKIQFLTNAVSINHYCWKDKGAESESNQVCLLAGRMTYHKAKRTFFFSTSQNISQVVNWDLPKSLCLPAEYFTKGPNYLFFFFRPVRIYLTVVSRD